MAIHFSGHVTDHNLFLNVFLSVFLLYNMHFAAVSVVQLWIACFREIKELKINVPPPLLTSQVQDSIIHDFIMQI